MYYDYLTWRRDLDKLLNHFLFIELSGRLSAVRVSDDSFWEKFVWDQEVTASLGVQI